MDDVIFWAAAAILAWLALGAIHVVALGVFATVDPVMRLWPWTDRVLMTGASFFMWPALWVYRIRIWRRGRA